MFWSFNPSSPQIDTVLFKEDLTLNELLDQENVLQELKSQNKKLVDFITRHDVMSQLVNLVTEEPSLDLDEREKYRRPNMACEVLTTDIPVINERLSEKSFLAELYAFLEKDPPLNPLLASFFSRTLSMLISRKTDQYWYSYQFTCLQVLDFFISRNNSLELLLKHIGTSAIMDFTLTLITQVEGPEMQQNILNWFENDRLVENLVSLFHPNVDADRHYNTAQLLCDTIHKLREDMTTSNNRRKPNPILESIQSPEMIGKLLGNMLGDEIVESSIVGGISVLLALLEQTSTSRVNNQQEDSSSGEQVEVIQWAINTTVTAILPFLPKLHDLLLNPPKRDPVKLAYGTIEPPLGNTRLSIIKLFAALIATNTPEVNAELDRLNTVQVLLDLFFQYTWNNFLHTQVNKCFAFALNTIKDGSENNVLIANIFIKCRLLQRILGAWEDNETEENKGGKRRGYMGHLVNIANIIADKMYGPLGQFLEENLDPDTRVAWQHYVENALDQVNSIGKGSVHPADCSSKDNADFKDVSFSSSSADKNDPEYSQKSTDYLEFLNLPGNENVNAHVDADLEPQNLRTREEIFKELCLQIDQIGLDAFVQNPKEEWNNGVWVQMPNSVWNTPVDYVSNSSDNSPEGEDKETAEALSDGFMSTDLWNSVSVGMPVVDPGNPWLKSDATPSEEADKNEGWADFQSNFLTEDNMEKNFEAIQLSSSSSESPTVPPECIPSSGGSDGNASKNTDVVVVSKEDSEKSDNNANLNSRTQEDTIPDDELIDNFRFLSKQGMMTENATEPTNAEVVGDVKEEKSPEPSSACGTVANETEKKNEVPGDPV